MSRSHSFEGARTMPHLKNGPTRPGISGLVPGPKYRSRTFGRTSPLNFAMKLDKSSSLSKYSAVGRQSTLP